MQDSGISKRRKSQRESGSAEYVARRKEILQAAAEIFKKKGYGGTSVNDIAQILNLDRATLYYYSGSKTELYQEIVQTAVESNVEIAESIAAGDLSPLQKLQKLVSDLIENFKNQYPFMQAYWQEDMARVKSTDTKWAKTMTKLARRFDDIVIAMVVEGQEKGLIRKDGEARLLAYAVIGLLNSVHRWFKPEGGYGAEHIGDIFGAVLIDGMKSEVA